jgi:cell division protein FtsQ
VADGGGDDRDGAGPDGGVVKIVPGQKPASGAGSDAGRPGIDPRIRSRRIHVRRSAGRRRLRRLTLALAVVATVVLGIAATRTSLLDVDHVRVSGVDGTRAEAVRQAAAVPADLPLASLDAGVVAARVEELPWVESAQVSRSWPATVRVRVTPRVVVAAVQVTEDHLALVDAQGYVVAIEEGAVGAPDDADGAGGGAGGATDGALVLTGIDGPISEGRRLDGDARDALTIAAAVAERLPGEVVSVSTDLDAELAAGGVVRFGSTEDLAEKITAVKTVVSDVDTTCMALLDVRVPGSPALTRNQGCP